MYLCLGCIGCRIGTGDGRCWCTGTGIERSWAVVGIGVAGEGSL